MLNYADLEYKILQLIEQAAIKTTIGTLQGGRLVLGSIAGPGGGSGGPLMPFIGQLAQTGVAYDTSELATFDLPASGLSLLDNLNRIRSGEVIIPDYSPDYYTVTISGTLNEHLEGIDGELGTLEITVSGILASGIGGGGHVIVWPDEEELPQRDNLSFDGMVGVEDDEESTTIVHVGMRNIKYVDQNDSYCDYHSIQDAIDSLGFSTNKLILIAPGTYEEDLVIPANTVVKGQDRTKCTIEGTVELQDGTLSNLSVIKEYSTAEDVYGVFVASGYVSTIEDVDIDISNDAGTAYAFINSGTMNFQDSYFTATSAGGGSSTTVDLSASADTYLSSYDSGALNRNYGTQVCMIAGNDAGEALYRPMLAFDLSSISGEITEAELALYNGHNAYSYDVTLYRILPANSGWIEGTKGSGTACGNTSSACDAGAGEPCWAYKEYDTVSWAGSDGLGTADTDYDSSALGSVSSVLGTNYFTIEIDAEELEKMRNGTYTNAGFLLKTDEAHYGVLYVASKENETVLYRPKLSITYSTGSAVTPAPLKNYGELISNREQVVISSGVEPTNPQPYMLWIDIS